MNTKQLRILNVLHRVKNPTLHELSAMTGVAMANLVWHIACLHDQGYIDRVHSGDVWSIRPTHKTALIKINHGYSTLVEVVYSDPVNGGGIP